LVIEINIKFFSHSLTVLAAKQKLVNKLLSQQLAPLFGTIIPKINGSAAGKRLFKKNRSDHGTLFFSKGVELQCALVIA
jgi:hypothetical protein